MAKQEPLRILCLDGGGVGGFSSLHLLKELMAAVRRQEEAPNDSSRHQTQMKPHRYFDLICGTSTGGLIALMLGRLQYDVETAIVKYNELCEKIFTSKCSNPDAAYDHERLEEAINHVVQLAPIANDRKDSLKDTCNFSDNDACRTFVLTTRYRGSGSQAYRMRSYSTMHNDAFQTEIWKAARATSAAPTFFLPIRINGITYGDGGTGWNNPTSEAMSEAHEIWPNCPIACLVSLGTGLEDASQLRVDANSSRTLFGSAVHKFAPSLVLKKAVAEYCVSCLTSCEVVHEEISSNIDRHRLRGRYFRLNVPQGMNHIGLEEWKTLEDIATLAEDYMRTGEIRDLKQIIARLLRNPSLARETTVNGIIDQDMQAHMRTFGLSNGEISSWQHLACEPQRLKTSDKSHQTLLEGSARCVEASDLDMGKIPSDQKRIEACKASASDLTLNPAGRPKMGSVAASGYSNGSSTLLHDAHKIPPFSRNADFVGRAKTMQLLRSTLAPGGGNEMRVFAICGPAGIGKTQAASHFVWTWKHLFNAVFWVRGKSSSTLRQDFLDIAMRLGLRQKGEEQSDAKTSISKLKQWLENSGTSDTISWLIVLDEVNDIADLDEYIPMTFSGSILITSRDSSIDSPRRFRSTQDSGCYLCSLDEDEAVTLLLNVKPFDCGDNERQAASIIASRLGRFPAALARVVETLKRYELSFQDYLETHDGKASLDEVLRDEKPFSTQEPNFASNWKLQSFNTSQLLAFLAFFDGKHVAEEIFKHKKMDRELKGMLKSYERERYELSKCSLVHINREKKALSIERLIQDALLSRMTPERFASAFISMIRLLLSAWPFLKSHEHHGAVDLQAYETLIHHIYRLPEHMQDPRAGRVHDDEKGETSHLIASGAHYLAECGNFRGSKYLSDFVVTRSPEQGFDVARCLYTLGCIALEENRYSDVKRNFTMLNTLASVLRCDRDKTYLLISMAKSGLGLIAVLDEQWEEASKRFAISIDELYKVDAPTTSIFLSPLIALARVLCRQERFAEAEDELQTHITELARDAIYDPSPLQVAGRS